MKSISSKIFQLNILLIAILLTVSCDKDSDLLTEYMLLDSLNTENLGEYVINEDSETILDQNVILNVPMNESFLDLEASKIIQTSESLVGLLKTNY